MSFINLMFWLQFATTWAMIGANIFVYLVHYPGFKFYKGKDFEELEKFHIRRTLSIALPFLFLEAFTSVILMIYSFHWLFILNTSIIALILICTFWKCLPLHVQMRKEKKCEITLEYLENYHLLRVILLIASGILLFFAAAPFCLHH